MTSKGKRGPDGLRLRLEHMEWRCHEDSALVGLPAGRVDEDEVFPGQGRVNDPVVGASPVAGGAAAVERDGDRPPPGRPEVAQVGLMDLAGRVA